MMLTAQDVLGVVCGTINVGAMFRILIAYAEIGLWMNQRPEIKSTRRKAFVALVYGSATLVLTMISVTLFTVLTVLGVLPKTTYFPIAAMALVVALILMRLHLWIVRQCQPDLE